MDVEDVAHLQTLEAQREALNKERARRQAILLDELGREAANALPPLVRFHSLLSEAYRHETARILRMTQKPHELRAREHKLSDLQTSYSSLLREVRRVLTERKELPLQQQNAIVNQAISCFASLFPWSSTLLCPEVNPYDPQFSLYSGKCQVTIGNSGNALILSFSATTMCATKKNEIAALRKAQALREGVASLEAFKRATQEEQERTISRRSTESEIDEALECRTYDDVAFESADDEEEHFTLKRQECSTFQEAKPRAVVMCPDQRAW